MKFPSAIRESTYISRPFAKLLRHHAVAAPPHRLQCPLLGGTRTIPDVGLTVDRIFKCCWRKNLNYSPMCMVKQKSFQMPRSLNTARGPVVNPNLHRDTHVLTLQWLAARSGTAGNGRAGQRCDRGRVASGAVPGNWKRRSGTPGRGGAHRRWDWQPARAGRASTSVPHYCPVHRRPFRKGKLFYRWTGRAADRVHHYYPVSRPPRKETRETWR